MNGRCRDFPHIPTPVHSLPHYPHPEPLGAFAIINEPPWTHHHHPESVVYKRSHSCSCMFYGIAQMCFHHDDIIQSIFMALKPLCALFIPPCPQPWATSDLFTVSIVWRFWNVTELESHWLPSLSDTHLRFLPVFSWPDAHLLAALIIFPCLDGPCMCPSPPEEHLVASKSGQL